MHAWLNRSLDGSSKGVDPALILEHIVVIVERNELTQQMGIGHFNKGLYARTLARAFFIVASKHSKSHAGQYSVGELKKIKKTPLADRLHLQLNGKRRKKNFSYSYSAFGGTRNRSALPISRTRYDDLFIEYE